jgi:hypothetical protein
LHPGKLPVRHPKKQPSKADASFKAEQDKRRSEEALANATGLRVLQTIVAAVPVRLTKRDLLFIAEQMLPLLDEKRIEIIARNHIETKCPAAGDVPLRPPKLRRGRHPFGFSLSLFPFGRPSLVGCAAGVEFRGRYETRLPKPNAVLSSIRVNWIDICITYTGSMEDTQCRKGC